MLIKRFFKLEEITRIFLLKNYPWWATRKFIRVSGPGTDYFQLRFSVLFNELQRI